MQSGDDVQMDVASICSIREIENWSLGKSHLLTKNYPTCIQKFRPGLVPLRVVLDQNIKCTIVPVAIRKSGFSFKDMLFLKSLTPQRVSSYRKDRASPETGLALFP